MTTLNSVGQRLLVSLTNAVQSEATQTAANANAEIINVVGAGGTVTAAYEQLRNAAENAEEHLLLQNAIRRFYKRLFVTRDETLIASSGNELAVELTFAGYVPNNSLTRSQVDRVSQLAIEHYNAYETLLNQRTVQVDVATKWLLDTVASRVAGVIDSRDRVAVFVEVAFAYFDGVLPELPEQDIARATDYRASLLAVIHKALLKSDMVTIRGALLGQYGVTVAQLDQFVAYNQRIDALQKDPLTDTIFHVIDRQGAPLRILKRMMDDRPDFLDILSRREVFLEAYEQQVLKEYSSSMTRVNRAIIRSVVFLLITKVLIGVAVEVPYDLWAHGSILWQPLLINLLFPPLYMIALRLTLTIPGYTNTSALVDQIDSMLYGERQTLHRRVATNKQFSSIFSILYGVFGLAIFGGVTWLLLMLGFALVHIAIFFVFISAASFLGFRISRLIRELEVVRSASNGLTFIRDFIYLPFVVVGRWMSDQYSQINVVTLVLDMLIELPLKTILRLVRQWGAFIDDRKDRI